MIKVLGLALYGPLAASTRYRLIQYVSGLARSGIDLQVHYLLDDEYLRCRFNGGKPSFALMLKLGMKRLADLMHQRRFEAAMLHCELFPLIPGYLERILLRLPYTYDFDDAFYLKYRGNKFGFMQPLLGNKFDTVLAGASAVSAGSQVLFNYAKQFNNDVHYLPTVVDTTRYIPKCAIKNDVFTVGWIGSPSTSRYLELLVQPLMVLGKEGPLRLVVIGGKAPVIPNVTVIEIDWKEDDEVDLINSFDVGVMPLPDDDWARGKCAFKLIQYMACAVPVIASPVGANVDVVDSCGLLADTSVDWINALRTLRDKPEIRNSLGQAGRERIMDHYSLHRNLPIAESIIRQVLKG